jgi:hypothetical protein
MNYKYSTPPCGHPSRGELAQSSSVIYGATSSKGGHKNRGEFKYKHRQLKGRSYIRIIREGSPYETKYLSITPYTK